MLVRFANIDILRHICRMEILASYLGNLFEYASYRAVSEEVLRSNLRDKNIDVCNENNTVTETEYLNVFETLLQATNDKNFGIHYGCYLNIKALGFIVQLSLNASTIEQSVFILQNYLRNTFPLVSIDSKKNKGKYTLYLLSEIEDEALKSQVLDFLFCFIYRELKLMLPNDLIPESEVPNSNTTEFEKCLNGEIKKGRKYSFTFDAAILNTEINKKQVKAIEILLPRFLQMLDKRKPAYQLFSLQVRNMILSMCCPELPAFEQVAIQFPLSNRTIQRKLLEEGMSFRKITDDIKCELSCYLSKGHKMKTQDIAYLLGYSDASSYLHAVKKWEMKYLL